MGTTERVSDGAPPRPILPIGAESTSYAEIKESVLTPAQLHVSDVAVETLNDVKVTADPLNPVTYFATKYEDISDPKLQSMIAKTESVSEPIQPPKSESANPEQDARVEEKFQKIMIGLQEKGKHLQATYVDKGQTLTYDLGITKSELKAMIREAEDIKVNSAKIFKTLSTDNKSQQMFIAHKNEAGEITLAHKGAHMVTAGGGVLSLAYNLTAARVDVLKESLQKKPQPDDEAPIDKYPTAKEYETAHEMNRKGEAIGIQKPPYFVFDLTGKTEIYHGFLTPRYDGDAVKILRNAAKQTIEGQTVVFQPTNEQELKQLCQRGQNAVTTSSLLNGVSKLMWGIDNMDGKKKIDFDRKVDNLLVKMDGKEMTDLVNSDFDRTQKIDEKMKKVEYGQGYTPGESISDSRLKLSFEITTAVADTSKLIESAKSHRETLTDNYTKKENEISIKYDKIRADETSQIVKITKDKDISLETLYNQSKTLKCSFIKKQNALSVETDVSKKTKLANEIEKLGKEINEISTKIDKIKAIKKETESKFEKLFEKHNAAVASNKALVANNKVDEKANKIKLLENPDFSLIALEHKRELLLEKITELGPEIHLWGTANAAFQLISGTRHTWAYESDVEIVDPTKIYNKAPMFAPRMEAREYYKLVDDSVKENPALSAAEKSARISALTLLRGILRPQPKINIDTNHPADIAIPASGKTALEFYTDLQVIMKRLDLASQKSKVA